MTTKERFDRFWGYQLKKVGKYPTAKVFERLLTHDELPDDDTLEEKCRAYFATDKVKRGFILDPRTWLSQRRWEDEHEPAKPVNDPEYPVMFPDAVDQPPPPLELRKCQTPGCPGASLTRDYCNKCVALGAPK